MTEISILLVALAWAGPSSPPAESAAWLVGFNELERRLDQPNLRLLDARPRADYDKGHIPVRSG